MSLTTDSVFSASDEGVSQLYVSLLQALSSFGPVTADPKKTSIHLLNRTAFAGIHPRKNYLNLEFKSVAPIAGPRIQKSEQTSKHRFHNTVRLTDRAELDSELLAWLRAAYDLSS
jgi:hypothetical protein